MQHVGRIIADYIGTCSGLIVMEVLLIAIGGLGFANPSAENQGAAWAVGSMLLLFTFVYDFTVGPVCYCLVAELSSTRLRAKVSLEIVPAPFVHTEADIVIGQTVVLARNLYNMGGILNVRIEVSMARFSVADR